MLKFQPLPTNIWGQVSSVCFILSKRWWWLFDFDEVYEHESRYLGTYFFHRFSITKHFTKCNNRIIPAFSFKHINHFPRCLALISLQVLFIKFICFFRYYKILSAKVRWCWKWIRIVKNKQKSSQYLGMWEQSMYTYVLYCSLWSIWVHLIFKFYKILEW